MKIFETHAHLDSHDFDKDRGLVLERCRKAGVEKIMNIGCNAETSEKSLLLAEKYDNMYCAVGWHPNDASTFDEIALRRMLKHPKVKAIGETGLDYYRQHTPHAVQKEVFEKHIILAKEFQLPLVVHNRQADGDCLQILEKHKPELVVFHCFSGDINMAQQVIGNGWMLSFTGTVTFKNSRQDDVIRLVPARQMMIETDCPYLAPVPFRGKRNEPSYLRYVVEKLSEIIGRPPKQIADVTYKNALRFFAISE
ncbi:MAG: TatD family hydrolase [Candidatus Cloacimonetes bacterium]|nr:TatD family hydrolase [Candidatus Cloacimonadota bacterium]